MTGPANLSFSDPQAGRTLRKVKIGWKVRSCRNCIMLFVVVNAVMGIGLQQME